MSKSAWLAVAAVVVLGFACSPAKSAKTDVRPSPPPCPDAEDVAKAVEAIVPQGASAETAEAWLAAKACDYKGRFGPICTAGCVYEGSSMVCKNPRPCLDIRLEYWPGDDGRMWNQRVLIIKPTPNPNASPTTSFRPAPLLE